MPAFDTTRSRKGPVLLAEDQRVNQLVTLCQLEDLGYEVCVVGDGEKAVRAVEHHEFALIFMDCQMPLMDGFEATRRIRQWQLCQGRRTPIIAITAGAQADDRQTCLDAGMDDFLTKPFQKETLKAILCKWLNIGEEFARGKHQSQQTSSVIDFDALRVRFPESRVQELLEAFVSDMQIRLPHMKGLAEKSDWTELSREAHSLKGACGILFAKPMLEATEALELASRHKDAPAIQVSIRELSLLMEKVQAAAKRQLK